MERKQTIEFCTAGLTASAHLHLAERDGMNDPRHRITKAISSFARADRQFGDDFGRASWAVVLIANQQAD